MKLPYTYLDICMADARLKLINMVNNKLGTHLYDNNHKAIIIEIDLQNISIEIKPEDNSEILQFKKTSWKKFTKYLS